MTAAKEERLEAARLRASTQTSHQSYPCNPSRLFCSSRRRLRSFSSGLCTGGAASRSLWLPTLDVAFMRVALEGDAMALAAIQSALAEQLESRIRITEVHARAGLVGKAHPMVQGGDLRETEEGGAQGQAEEKGAQTDHSSVDSKRPRFQRSVRMGCPCWSK